MKVLLYSDLHNEFDRFIPPDLPADLVILAGDIDIMQRVDAAQLGDAFFQLGDRLLEIEIGNHCAALVRCCPTCKRVAGIDEGNQPRSIDMSVDLRRGDVRVAQQRLQNTQVRAAFQQVGGKGMAQHMRADRRRIEPRAPGQRLDQLKQSHPAEMRAAL